MKFIKRLFSSDVTCKTCGNDKHNTPIKDFTAGYVDGSVIYGLRKDKKGPWDSLDIFGEEKWGYIKSGIIKLYGVNQSDWDWYSRHLHIASHRKYLREIPLGDIPGISNEKLYWDYQDYELSAAIWKVSYEERDHMVELLEDRTRIWNHVNVITPIKVMSEMIMREREKRKAKEEKLRCKREKFILDSKDDTLCDLLKVVAECE